METMRRCPYCDEEIRAEAIRCRHCRSRLTALDPSTWYRDLPDRRVAGVAAAVAQACAVPVTAARFAFLVLTPFHFVGVIAYAGALAFRAASVESAWLAGHRSALGAGLLLVAGAYQFSALKYRCLDKCRSPFSFVVEHWTGEHHARQALWLGVHHGVFCVGCCWTLMLLMFPFGAGNLGWMLVLGILMAIEKNLPWGRRFGRPLGVVLLVAGGIVALT